VNERQLRKIQKQRHMSNIFIMLLNNPLFKNLSDRDQRKIAKLIYKAEMIDRYARDKETVSVNVAIQDIISSLNAALQDDNELSDEEDNEDPTPDNFK
jgi:hypothetical protein